MTENQRKFVELERKKDEVKKFYDDLAAATEVLVKETGVGSYFQDEQGVVYKVVIPAGKFVHFDKFGVVRTRRPHEDRGDLSLKEAESAGFKIPDRK